ncbi:MAG: hypothetical protein J3Q66DRAFT_424598 [Benniella sp.]|nr:MAG: hypothetical protein J3Q66DRAFT_424598 [Benniella sp.]
MPTPKRAMVLTGLPTPALPPRLKFPPELEHYQVQEESTNLTLHVQAYLSSLCQDYQRRLKEYDMLKKALQDDTSFSNVVIDQLDALDENPFTLDSFENLMRLHATKDKDFIIARVTTQDPNDENKFYHSYYGAHQTPDQQGLVPHTARGRSPASYESSESRDVNAIKPLPTVHSSSSSVSSHSSRKSRCSELAAQAIASQWTFARSSLILGSDMSLFSRSSDIESPISILPHMMASLPLGADQEETDPSVREQDGMSTRARRGSLGSASSPAPTTLQNTFQPGRPSRLRQTIHSPVASNPANPLTAAQNQSDQGELDTGDAVYSPMNSPARNHKSHPQQQGQSPLFQNLMAGRMRSRSNTISSVASDKTDQSHVHPLQFGNRH